MDEKASPLYGMGRVVEALGCSASTVRRLAAQAGVNPVFSAGGRKFTSAQIKQLKKYKANKRRFENLPPHTRTVSMVADDLDAKGGTIRAAIKRLEAREPGRVIGKQHTVSQYGKPLEALLLRDDEVGLIERALRSPRRRVRQHPNAIRGRGGSVESRKRAFLRRENLALRELRHKVVSDCLSRISVATADEPHTLVKALRWMIRANVLRYVARRICLTGFYAEMDEIVERVNGGVLRYLLKRPPLPTEAESVMFHYERDTSGPFRSRKSRTENGASDGV